MIEDAKIYLVENTDLKSGKTLFLANQPDSPADCVTLIETGGGSPYQELSVDLPTIQIIARGSQKNYGKTMERANEIFNLLNRKIHITIGSKHAMRVFALATPQSLGRDEKGRWEIVTNFSFQIRNDEN